MSASPSAGKTFAYHLPGGKTEVRAVPQSKSTGGSGASAASALSAAAGAAAPSRAAIVIPARNPAPASAATTAGSLPNFTRTSAVSAAPAATAAGSRTAAATSTLSALAAATPYKRPAGVEPSLPHNVDAPLSARSSISAAAASDDTAPLSNPTPGGLSLGLSGEHAGPSLIAARTRSERLRAACRAEDASEVAKLLSGVAEGGLSADTEQADGYGTTALMIAAGAGNAPIVEELLHAGAQVHTKDKYGQTALHYACAVGSYAVAKLLLERRAGANVQSGARGQGHTPLMKAAYVTHPHAPLLADLLLLHRARPDIQTGGGGGGGDSAGAASASAAGSVAAGVAGGASAASIAVEQGHLEVLRVLHHYGANMNLQNKSNGDTLLHIAARKNGFAMIAHLVSMGADPSIPNASGRVASQITPEAPAGSAALSASEFAAKVSAAVERGLAVREEARREAEQNQIIIKQLQQQRKAQQQAAAAAQAAQARGNAPAAAPAAEVEETKSRPTSAGLSAEELKARTYKPKLDPTSVFGEAYAPPARASSHPAAATASSTSAASAPDRELTQEEQDALDDEEDRVRRAAYAAQYGADDDGDDALPLSYHDILQLRGQAQSLASAATPPSSTAPAPAGPGSRPPHNEDEEEMTLVDQSSY